MDLFNRLYKDIRLRYGTPEFWYWKLRGGKPITINGFTVILKISNYIGDFREIEFFENNEKGEMEDILMELRPDDIFLDIGANIGIHSLFASKITNEVYAVEPHPVNNSHLLINEAINESDMTVFECAFSDTGQYIQLAGPRGGFLADGSAAFSEFELPSKRGPGDKKNTIHVRTERGDELIEQEDIPIPTVIKIDVEAAERKVIDGLMRTIDNQQCRLIYCEIHEDRLDYNNIVSKLESSGFKIEVIDARDYSRTIKGRR